MQEMTKPSSNLNFTLVSNRENYCINVFSLIIFSDSFLGLTATAFSATNNDEKNFLFE